MCLLEEISVTKDVVSAHLQNLHYSNCLYFYRWHFFWHQERLQGNCWTVGIPHGGLAACWPSGYRAVRGCSATQLWVSSTARKASWGGISSPAYTGQAILSLSQAGKVGAHIISIHPQACNASPLGLHFLQSKQSLGVWKLLGLLDTTINK